MQMKHLFCCSTLLSWCFAPSLYIVSAFQVTPIPFSSRTRPGQHCNSVSCSTSSPPLLPSPMKTTSSARWAYSGLDADFAEMMVGGTRYEMVPLPDSMMDTTLFVGNFCEFVHDGDLSDFFKPGKSRSGEVYSHSYSVPACVARKPNQDSLRYGFVSFVTEEEKEAAILRYHGSEWRGKTIKVEPIKDIPGRGRVRVPEKLVSYVTGKVKKIRGGEVNTMRRATTSNARARAGHSRSRNGVENHAAGDSPNKRTRQPSKKKRGRPVIGSSNNNSRNYYEDNDALSHWNQGLNAQERDELDRAARRGYLTLDQRSNSSKGNVPKGKHSRLITVHRRWCDAREQPQIVHYKAAGKRYEDVCDEVVVDLSSLRRIVSKNEEWKTQIIKAASTAGMELRQGTFHGYRSNAKAMAKALASLCCAPQLEQQEESLEAPKFNNNIRNNRGNRSKSTKLNYKNRNAKFNNKKRGLSEHRRERGGGHRQAFMF